MTPSRIRGHKSNPPLPVNFRSKLAIISLEDRAVPAFGFGSAFSFGGTPDDSGYYIQLDPTGNQYVSGTFAGTVNFDPKNTNTGSPDTLTADASGDAFVAKYSPNGTFQWVVALGPGPNDAFGGQVAVDGTSVYAAYFNKNDGAYLAKLSAATGTVAWNSTITDNDDGQVYAVTLSPAGNLYVGGLLHSTFGDGSHVFISRLDPASGESLWTQTPSGDGGFPFWISVDNAENVYAAGYFIGTTTFGSTTLTVSSGQSSPTYQNGVLWKMDANGNSLWVGQLGSNLVNRPRQITTDAAGNVYVTGWFSGTSNDFDPGPNTVSLTNRGGEDIFVAKYSPNTNGGLSLIWVKGIGGTGHNRGFDVEVDGTGNVYSTGYYNGTVDFNPNSTNSSNRKLQSSGLGTASFVSKLSNSGLYVDSANIAAAQLKTGNADSRALELDSAKNVYLTGTFSGTIDFNPTSAKFNLRTNGGTDAFVVKLTQSSPLEAAGQPANPKPQTLTSAQLQPLLTAAIDRWAAAGLDAAKLNVMRNATVTIADLGVSFLGLADVATNGIRLDDDAAGFGWYVDRTPYDDSEFTRSGKLVDGRMDLLSAVTHELGHLVGLDDDHFHGANVMGDTLTAGTRRMPTAASVRLIHHSGDGDVAHQPQPAPRVRGIRR